MTMRASIFVAGMRRRIIPWDVMRDEVHPSVKAIEEWEFSECSQLTIVNLGEGLEEIGEGAFQLCTSLHETFVPDAVKAIKELAFSGCSGLTIVILGEGLEEMGEAAFGWCDSLARIVIPPAVKAIQAGTFNRCSQLSTVKI